MADKNLSEVWLRGPVADIEAPLQPILHTLLQAQEEINDLIKNFPDGLLWLRPAGLASPAFHLQHITGVIDRMITYKNGKPLNAGQFAFLENEGKYDQAVTSVKLLHAFNQQIEKAINELKHTYLNTLTEYRAVGRKQLPSTVGGLLFHMAEHTMRHTGQLLVTVSILLDPNMSKV